MSVVTDAAGANVTTLTCSAVATGANPLHVGEPEGVGHRVGHPAGHRVEVAVRDDDGDAGTQQASGAARRTAVGHEPSRRAEQQRVIGDDDVDRIGLEAPRRPPR